MDEKEYSLNCSKTFAEIEAYLEDQDGDFDFDNNNEICEVSFDDGRKIIISRQPPLKEIWLADRSGGFHFRYKDGVWTDTKDGVSLFERLRICIEG